MVTSSQADRGYQAQVDPNTIFNAPIYGGSQTPTHSPGGFSSATSGFSSAGVPYGGGGGGFGGPQTHTTGGSSSTNAFDAMATGGFTTPQQSIAATPIYSGGQPQQSSISVSSYAPQDYVIVRQPIPSETMSVSTNYPVSSLQNFQVSKPQSVERAYSPSIFRSPVDTAFQGMTPAERFVYRGEQLSSNLQQGNQYQYVAGATLGFGVGIVKFGSDFLSDVTGKGFKQLPFTETVKGTYAFLSDIPSGLKGVGSQFMSNPYESAGYYGAPIIFGRIAEPVRESFISATSKNIPSTNVLNPGALSAVESGTKSYPSVRNVESLYSEFQHTITSEGNLRVVTASPAPLTSYGQSRVINVGESEFGLKGRESTGLYVAPYGQGNPAFFKIISSDEIYGVSFFPKISRPTLSVIDVSPESFGRVPKNILIGGVESENIFLRSQPNKVFLTGNVERAFNPSFLGRATAEYEAVVTPGSTLKSTGGILGYSENVVVSGRTIPLRGYILSSEESSPISKVFSEVYPSRESFRYEPKLGSYVYESKSSLAASNILGLSYYKPSTSYVPKYSSISYVSDGYVTSSGYILRNVSYSLGSVASSYGGFSSYNRTLSPVLSSSLVGSSLSSAMSRISSSPIYSSSYSRNINSPYNFSPNYDLKFGFEKSYKNRKVRSKFSRRRVAFLPSELFILPDLRSVDITEAQQFNFGKTLNRAFTPKATRKVKELSYAAFKGYSTGFVPTEQIRTGKIKTNWRL